MTIPSDLRRLLLEGGLLYDQTMTQGGPVQWGSKCPAESHDAISAVPRRWSRAQQSSSRQGQACCNAVRELPYTGTKRGARNWFVASRRSGAVLFVLVCNHIADTAQQHAYPLLVEPSAPFATLSNPHGLGVVGQPIDAWGPCAIRRHLPKMRRDFLHRREPDVATLEHSFEEAVDDRQRARRPVAKGCTTGTHNVPCR